MPTRFLQRSCLRPNLSLRRQLLISFGSSAFLTLFLVVLLTSIAAYRAGEDLKEPVEATTRAQVLDNFHVATQNHAAQWTQLVQNIDGTVQLMVEYVQDRIVGYPFSDDGLNNSDHDTHVPFRDRETGNYRYPLDIEPLPVDWKIYGNVVPETAREHLQEREQWLSQTNAPLSTATASWFVQGLCDPKVNDDPNHWAYYPNCTDAHNDLSTGGIIQPTSTAKALHDVSGDLCVLLKPLYEAQLEAYVLLLAFFNDGAGAMIQFPGTADRGFPPYKSEGCDWLLTTINPYTKRPLGTQDQVSRCHPAGSLVHAREYNPIERAWFRTVAMASTTVKATEATGNVVSHGPFSVLDSGFDAMMFGKAMYDRRTGEFLGIASALVAQTDLIDLLRETSVHESSSLAIVRFESGNVWAESTGLQPDWPIHIGETNIIDQQNWKRFRDAVTGGELGRDKVEQRMEEATYATNGHVKMAYPLRTPPDDHDDSYRPEFLVVHSFPEDAIFFKGDDLSDSVNDDVREQIYLSVGCGIMGLVLILATVWFVSRFLTHSLVWMERVAFHILNHAETDGDKAFDDDFYDSTKAVPLRWFSRNEISRLVEEFDKMIHGFSGSSAAIVAEPELAEVRNEITWHTDFRKLYSVPENVDLRNSFRKRVSFSERRNSIENFDASGHFLLPADLCPDSAAASGPAFAPAPRKMNYGANVNRKLSVNDGVEKEHVRMWRSSLFWGIFLLLTVPLIIINALISSVILTNIQGTMPSWISIAAGTSVELEVDSLRTLAESKARFASSFLHEPVRNAHILARLAGWLYFDAIQRADSFTEAEEGTEECKIYPNDRSCPFFSPETTPCPCEWSDFDSIRYCEDAFNDTLDTRYLQRAIFSVQARDADPVTGDRTSAAGFPEFDDLPNTTLWWSDIDELPGSERGSSASGFQTTYDRLRVASAMAVAEFPIYNYVTSLGRENSNLGTFLAFDGDGLFVGFPGCDYGSANYAHFQSSDENRAAEVAPTLCPKGKYGYDPRCRPWYAEGLKNFEETREGLHVTPPYDFVAGRVGTSAVSPIINLRTKEFVGNVLYDFLATDIRYSYRRTKENIQTFVVTPGLDAFGRDTVVRPLEPGLVISEEKVEVSVGKIEDLIYIYGETEDGEKDMFRKSVLEFMKAGEKGVGRYSRVGADGQTEIYIVAYAPITARSLLPLRHDDFSRGVASLQKLIYSGAAVVREEDLFEPFRAIKSDLQNEQDSTSLRFSIVIGFVSVVFVAFMFLVTVNIVGPIILLLRVVERINVGRVDRMPPMNGGSLEVRQVYSTFAKLSRVIRTSNTAFFSGNIEFASHTLGDALVLYRKLNDVRAIGVACNNLANTYYAATHTFKVHGVTHDISNDSEDIDTALALYDEAISIAQSDFDNEADIETKADFAEQLADRLFNRGLFLLLVQDDHEDPSDARESGLSDIARARELDYDVRGYWLEKGKVLERSSVLFSRLVRRIHGLVTFYDDDDLRATWDAKELVNDADELLSACSSQPNATVFEDLGLAGRLQQLEAAVIRLEMWLKNYPEAARMGARMFAEDEFLLEASFQLAAAAILHLNQEATEPLFSPKVVSSMKSDIRRMLRGCKSRPSISISKCIIFCIELSEQWDLDPLLEEVNANFLRLYDEACTQDDSIGLVSYADHGDDLTFGPSCKSENVGLHRSTLDIATNSTTTTRSTTFPVALQMVVDSEETTDRDTYILVLTDGAAWDISETELLTERVCRLNAERSIDVHTIILSLGVKDAALRAAQKRLGSVTPESHYIELDSGNIDSAFRDVTKLLSSNFHIRGDLQGITMEQF